MLLGAFAVVLLTMHTCSSGNFFGGGGKGSDTVVRDRLVVLPGDTVFLESGKAQVRYVPYPVFGPNGDTVRLVDTIFQTRPFVARLDTVMGCSSLQVVYRFPEHRFDSILAVSCPDTLTVHDTLIRERVGNTFWEDVGLVAAGAAGAIILAAGAILASQ